MKVTWEAVPTVESYELIYARMVASGLTPQEWFTREYLNDTSKLDLGELTDHFKHELRFDR